MSDDQFTEREVYFSLNGTTNVNLVAQMIFFYKSTLLLNARCADFISWKEGHKTVL